MDSRQNSFEEQIHDTGLPMPHHELLEFTLIRYRKRFDDLMRWINDVEKKAATLIAANGVVLALSVTLINHFTSLYQHVIYGDIISLFPI